MIIQVRNSSWKQLGKKILSTSTKSGQILQTQPELPLHCVGDGPEVPVSRLPPNEIRRNLGDTWLEPDWKWYAS